MAKHIEDEVISKCPRDPVTLHIRTEDLKPIPTPFLKGLDSRTQLLHQLLEKLNDDKVDSVGVFGMGGAGKTTLALEVKKTVKSIFSIKVIVEVSDVPDIARIQRAIAESIDLPLHDVNDITQRATRLYNRLISEKEKKVLIILDNVWKKLSLDDIGIPHTCKLLLTTREKEVCRVMGVQDGNIIKVGLMNINESRELFKSHTGNQVDVAKYRNVVERLLRKCGGLPLAIVATANSLKDKDFYSWEKFANELEKPISSQVTGDYRHIYSILDTSYKFIEVEEKRIFFLLASLSPLGSSMSVERLMRYGMGLNLFQHVNNLSEAMEQVATWANELMLSSMLIEGDVKGDVKIHDLVRAFALSYATKEEEHRFMVEGIPRWLDDETLKKYTAMSLRSKNDYSRLSGVETCKLQILILKGDLSPNFDGNFFNEMVNLKVLAVSNMNFQPSLPKSMPKLKKLRTLCMEGCKLGDIKLVGELVSLVVLSLCESSLDNLPNEVGNLCKLRLLDLSGCTTASKLPLIPSGVLSKLAQLEGLYMYNKRQSVVESTSVYEEENATENVRLPYLNAFEIKVAVPDELPINGQIIKNLERVKISIGNEGLVADQGLKKFSCILSLDGLRDVSGYLEKSYHLKELLKKADFLDMRDCSGIENLVPQFDQKGFRSLRSLDLSHCYFLKYIVDGRTMMNNVTAFPCLQSLTLKHLERLKMVCNGDVLPETFSNLQTIQLFSSNKLPYVLPLVPRNVKEIHVSDCKLLMFIFMLDEEELAIELPFLRTLRLCELPCLLSLVGPKRFFNSYDLQGSLFFFGCKMSFPSLELLLLEDCNFVLTLWSKEIYTPGFQNLKDIKIINCEKLSSLGSPSVLSILVQLETLTIKGCKEMREVISVEETQASEIISEQIVRFPELKDLELGNLSNLESFYGGGSKLEFPKLKKLVLSGLGSMQLFGKLENSSTLFHHKIDFPCLKVLHVIRVNDEVVGLWDKQAMSVTSNLVPMLRQLVLSSSTRLRQIPSVVLENLHSLTLVHFHDNDVVFSSSHFWENEEFVTIYSQLPNLDELKVEGSKSMKELFGKEDHNAINDAFMLFCGQIKTVELKTLPSLNLVPLHLFQSIVSLTLYKLKWDHIIAGHVLEDSLHQLQFLSIGSCDNMEVLLMNVSAHIKLPKLKQLHLCFLKSFTGICPISKKEAVLLLPLLESLVIEFCDKLEHFWSGSIIAPNLQEVSLRSCNKLQQFLVGNLVDTIELPSLRKLTIMSCKVIKSISTGSLTTPKLKEMDLWRCDRMECLFPRNPNHDGDVHLPSLENVVIRYCPNLYKFSLGRVVAPKLNQIIYEEKEHSMLPYDDLNHFLQKNNTITDTQDQEDF